MRNRYFRYLCQMIGRDSEYGYLLLHLHAIEFYSPIERDRNRAMDGKELRGGFGPSFCLSNEPCTVLEMLIGVAVRMADQLVDSPMERSVGECFWILIGNLGLIRYNNSAYMNAINSGIIDRKIQKFLDRRYNRDGLGGLFPLDDPPEDQREVEIWYQMSQYLVEKVEF